MKHDNLRPIPPAILLEFLQRGMDMAEVEIEMRKARCRSLVGILDQERKAVDNVRVYWRWCQQAIQGIRKMTS